MWPRDMHLLKIHKVVPLSCSILVALYFMRNFNLLDFVMKYVYSVFFLFDFGNIRLEYIVKLALIDRKEQDYLDRRYIKTG